MHPPAAPSDPAPFVDPRALLADALDAFLPPERVSVTDYTAEHRWLDNRGGGYVGRWSHDEAPYLRGPMDALSSRDYLTVAVAGPGRSGKTAVAENWLLHSACADPVDMLWYEPTDDAVESYVKRVINPMIDLHDGLRTRLGRLPIDRSIHFKRFGPMWVEFLAAAYSNLVGKSASRIVIDEYDACSDRDGDVYRLADVRRQSFGPESMVLAVSHPDRAEGLDPGQWHAGIMRLYAQSDRRTWWWPCPECNAWSSPAPTASRVMALHYDADAPLDEIADGARLLCPCCGALIEDKWRRAMNLDGRWIGTGEDIAEDGTVTGTRARRDIAGFWIVGVMSPFLLGGIGALARDMVAAEREAEASGDSQPVRDVLAKRWGIPPRRDRRIGSIDASALADRAETTLTLGEVPDGVRFLTAAIDVQANRFEVLVRGWGVRGESWIVDVLRRPADPATEPDQWDALLRELLARSWPLAGDAGRGMKLRALGWDSGGEPGVTTQAYDAWRRLRAARLAVLHGRVSGRDAWSAIPLKGEGGANRGRLAVVYPDSARRDRRAGARGQVPLARFASDAFKDDLAGQLSRAESGPWAVHFPAALRSPSPPHAWFEQLTAETRQPNGTWKASRGARNEATDLMVMTHALAHLHGIARIDWDRAPGWAEAWPRNTLIGATVAPNAASPAAASTTVPARTGADSGRASVPLPSADRLRRLVAGIS